MPHAAAVDSCSLGILLQLNDGTKWPDTNNDGTLDQNAEILLVLDWHAF